MFLWHFTPVRYLSSVQRWGLKTTHSRGKMQVIWLCTESVLQELGKHVAAHQRVAVGELALLMLNVPHLLPKRRRPGVFTCDVDLPAEAIVTITYLGRVPKNALV